MSTRDHAKTSANSCRSDNKESTSSQAREVPRLTCSSLFGPNRGCSHRGSTTLESSYSETLASASTHLFHRLQDSIGDYGVKLKDWGPKTFHKVLDELESPYPNVEKTCDTLF